MKRRCGGLESGLGPERRNAYGGAAPALGNKKPKFADIEKAVKLEHWRPRYGWTSGHNHAGHRPAINMLGTSESTEYVFLVGQSNSGFTDPIHMTALALTQITSALLLSKPSVDYLVIATILHNLSVEIGP